MALAITLPGLTCTIFTHHTSWCKLVVITFSKNFCRVYPMAIFLGLPSEYDWKLSRKRLSTECWSTTNATLQEGWPKCPRTALYLLSDQVTVQLTSRWYLVETGLCLSSGASFTSTIGVKSHRVHSPIDSQVGEATKKERFLGVQNHNYLSGTWLMYCITL